jgi:hypothetical protein
MARRIALLVSLTLLGLSLGRARDAAVLGRGRVGGGENQQMRPPKG